MSRSAFFLSALLFMGLVMNATFGNAIAKECTLDDINIFAIKVKDCVPASESSDPPYVSGIDKQTKSEIALVLPDNFTKFCKNGKIKKGRSYEMNAICKKFESPEEDYNAWEVFKITED